MRRRVGTPSALLISLLLIAAAACAPVYVRDAGLPTSPVPPAPSPERQQQAKEEQPRIDFADIIDKSGAPNTIWGILVRPAGSGRPVFARNADKLFTPASNMKLFTTAVALIKLGPDFRYATHVYATGPVRNGVLDGDLVVRGSGDPTISGKFHDRPAAVFEEWADRLKQKGIRAIRGNVIGDDRLFDRRDMGRGWAWDDELIYYSARISALSFNDNCFEVIIAPGEREGEPAQISVHPQTAYARVTNRTTTSGREDVRELDARRDVLSGGIVLSGNIHVGASPRRIRFTAANPTLYAVTVLKEVLEQKGIRVSGGPVDLDDTTTRIDYATMTPLIVHQSPPLSRIIEHVNKRSQNLYAELLFRTLGAVCAGEGSTEKSVKVMKQALAEMGIRADGVAIYDGSGLSRLNLVTPRQTVALLDAMSRHPDFRHFYRSLPLAGSEGTLITRMRNTDAENNIRAKTGTLTHMVALSGYVQGKDGRLLAFSIMSNNCLHPAADIRRLQDEMCQRLVRFWREQ